ncbi:hypothetical protein Dimus_024851 [Dionaea muscipula]
MAKRSTTTRHVFGVSPAPSPSEIHAPAVAPASGVAALMLKDSFLVAALALSFCVDRSTTAASENNSGDGLGVLADDGCSYVYGVAIVRSGGGPAVGLGDLDGLSSGKRRGRLYGFLLCNWCLSLVVVSGLTIESAAMMPSDDYCCLAGVHWL